jgi:hypothetical protein
MEYVSNEDKARGKQPKQRMDEATGLLQWKVTVSDPAAEKDREKSIILTMLARVQPVAAADRDRGLRLSAGVLRRSDHRAASDGGEVQVPGLGVSGDGDARTEWSGQKSQQTATSFPGSRQVRCVRAGTGIMRDIVQVHITAALPIRAQALPFANRLEVRFGIVFPAALIVDRDALDPLVQVLVTGRDALHGASEAETDGGRRA